MKDVSLVNKLSILNDMLLSSPLFLCSILLIEIAIIILILFKKKKFKINKWMVIGLWLFVLLFVIIIYNKVFINFIDNFINYIFMALYFPNLAVYSGILVISNSLFVFSIFSKQITKSHKKLNIIGAIVLDILLVFVIETVSSSNIDVYEKLTVFSNTKLLVLLELSTGIFTSWILLNLFINLKMKLKKYDKNEYPDIPEIIFN